MARRRKRRGDVEIYTDAGNRNGVGSWACYALRKDGRGGEFERSGPLRGFLDNSESCETRAIANALHAVFLAGYIDAGDLVVIRSDNMGAVQRINDRTFARKPAKRHIWEAADYARKLAKKGKFELHCRHVKGHQPLTSSDIHAEGNRRVDKLCSKVLLEGARPRPSARASERVDRLKNAVAQLSGR
jgi:hypothetical protein